MTEQNKRMNDRVPSKNLISYVCLNDKDKEVENGMGRTLNVSESGIMLETHNQISQDLTMMLSIGLEDSLIDIKGKIVHSTEVDKGRFHTGIQFIDLDDSIKKMLSKFIKAFISSSK